MIEFLSRVTIEGIIFTLAVLVSSSVFFYWLDSLKVRLVERKVRLMEIERQKYLDFCAIKRRVYPLPPPPQEVSP